MKNSDVIQLWLEAFNKRDAHKVADLYHDDAINLQLAIGVPLVGKAAILNDVDTFFKTIPDSYTTAINIVSNDEWVALEWQGGGTFQSKTPFIFEGCGFFQIIDGKIKVQRGYWDMHTWLKRLNLPME